MAPGTSAYPGRRLELSRRSAGRTRARIYPAKFAIRRRHRLAQIGRKAPTRYRADPGGHHLDRNHERRCEKHCPAQRIAELRAALGISGDAARIVVGAAGYDSGSKQAE